MIPYRSTFYRGEAEKAMRCQSTSPPRTKRLQSCWRLSQGQRRPPERAPPRKVRGTKVTERLHNWDISQGNPTLTVFWSDIVTNKGNKVCTCIHFGDSCLAHVGCLFLQASGVPLFLLYSKRLKKARKLKQSMVSRIHNAGKWVLNINSIQLRSHDMVQSPPPPQSQAPSPA